eukprot:gene7541-690_t
MLPIQCSVQNYDWGKEAQFSEVAKIARANGLEIDETKPFAELWMGTHPKGPSVVTSTGSSLQSWILEYPESLGAAVRHRFGAQLPFLFKMLSVKKALSIQSHPDKQLAEALHQNNPEMYADDNHKPEMALAISDFEALCGFAPLQEIQESLRSVPELRMGLGDKSTEALLSLTKPSKEVLKCAFAALMSCSPVKVDSLVRTLVARLQRMKAGAEAKRDVTSEASGRGGQYKRVRRTVSAPAPQHLHQTKPVTHKDAESTEERGESSFCSTFTNPDAKASKAVQFDKSVFEPTSLSADEKEASHRSSHTAEVEKEEADSADDTPTSSFSRLERQQSSELTPKELLVLRLNQQFPSDVGILSAFFLNLVKLAPGEAIYLAANEPHAYLQGELVECMATSDNVIRAGLTPKFKHTEVLCESLSYEQGSPHILKGSRQQLPYLNSASPSGAHMLTYRPPFDEFEVQCVQVLPGCSASLPVNPGPLIMLVLSGSGSAEAQEGAESSSKTQGLDNRLDIQRGSIIFVPALTKLSFKASSIVGECSTVAPKLSVCISAVNASFFE